MDIFCGGACIGKLRGVLKTFFFFPNLRMSIGNKIMIYVLPHILREPLCLRLSMGIKINYIKGFRNFLQMRFLTNGGFPI